MRSTELAPRAQALLARHFWPGNVRELDNVLGHACMIAGEIVDVADLPLYLRQGARQRVAEVIAFPSREPEGESDPTELSFDEQERRVLDQTLGPVAGNQVHAARLLGISRDRAAVQDQEAQPAVAPRCPGSPGANKNAWPRRTSP
jgi:DNA-binding NtrC family response regulator